MNRLLRRLTAAACTLALCLTSASALSVEQARQLLEEHYVEKLPAAVYEATTLDELFSAVGDPYTYYMPAEELNQFTDYIEHERSFTGMGASVLFTEEGVRIVSVFDGGGAKEAGLKSGDMIVAVNGASCVPATEEKRALFAGEAGSFYTVTVRRSDGATEDFRIELREVTVHNTTAYSENGVTVIDCNTFGTMTGDYFRENIEKYEDETRVWIVDVRNNPGGQAHAAVSSLGYFTGAGAKLYGLERDGGYFRSIHGSDAITDKPMIVLTNGYSASAAELFSGGIRANRGLVIGERTYGKGTAQYLYNAENMPDLFTDDAVKMTIYRFYCLDGNTTDKIGVIPTLLVPDGWAGAVAELLSAEKPEQGEYLRLRVNDWDYYIDATSLQSEENAATMSVLLSALPPDALLVRGNDEGAERVSIAEAVEKYGDPENSRWFDDVSESPWRTEINTLATYGILHGSRGAFSPARVLTRAELCAMLAQTLDIISNREAPFSDVSQDSWYAKSVNAMSALGLVNGVGGGCFDPEGTLTQEQLIAVMGRFAAFLNLSATQYEKNLEDDLGQFEELAAFAPWARSGAAILTEFAFDHDPACGTMLYTELENIDPQAPVTREQAAATLCKVLRNLGIFSY